MKCYHGKMKFQLHEKGCFLIQTVNRYIPTVFICHLLGYLPMRKSDCHRKHVLIICEFLKCLKKFDKIFVMNFHEIKSEALEIEGNHGESNDDLIK